MGALLVAADGAGVAVRGRKLLDRSRTVADVEFDRVSATKLAVNAERILAEASLRAAVLMAADALGASEWMLDLAVEHGGWRQQSGVPADSFRAVKRAAAAMLVAVESSRSIVYCAAASVEQRREGRHCELRQ